MEKVFAGVFCDRFSKTSVFDVLGSSPHHESWYKDFWTQGSPCNISAYWTTIGFFKRQFPTFILCPAKCMWLHVTHLLQKGEWTDFSHHGFRKPYQFVQSQRGCLDTFPWLLFWLKGNLELFFKKNWYVIWNVISPSLHWFVKCGIEHFYLKMVFQWVKIKSWSSHFSQPPLNVYWY